MRSFQEYLYYFIKRRSEKRHRAYYRDYYGHYLAAARTCDLRKSEGTIRRECNQLERYWRVDPVHYYRYGFYRSDCPLTVAQMKEYIPDYFAYYLFYPRSFKDRNVLCEDKQLMYAINAGSGIRQPRTLFFTRDGRILSAALDPLGREECAQTIAECRAEKLFVKPTFGVGGKGIAVFNRESDGAERLVDRASGQVFDALCLETLAKEGDYTIQEGVRQHEAMNAVYPHAINTLRIITECVGGRARIVLALLRMGCNGMQLDNASSGGIYAKIDVQTGTLVGRAIADNRETFDVHPTTGFRFDGAPLPSWREIEAFAVTVAEKYAPIRYVGWDIALSEEGPLLIEGNNGPSIEIVQDLYGGVKSLFGIDSPDAYWYASNYSLKNL